MHLRDLLDEPVNLTISILFILSFGLVVTSLTLQSAGLPDPLTSATEAIGLIILDQVFGATPVTTP